MSAWRRKAIDFLPHLKESIEHCYTLSELWWEVWPEFSRAYREEPINLELIAGVYEFAFWCWHGSDMQGNHISLITAVFVDFFERLPSDPIIRRDLPTWFCSDEFEVLLAGPFSYVLNPDEQERLSKEFRWAKQKRDEGNIARCSELRLQLPNP